MLRIPFSEFPAFTEEITLDGTVYRFAFSWNNRAGFWSMSIADRDGNPLLVGVRVVLNYGLIRQFPGRGLPTGEIIAIDPSGKATEITRDALGKTVNLIYASEDELAAV